MKFSNLLFCCAAILTFGAYMGAPTIGLALFAQRGPLGLKFFIAPFGRHGRCSPIHFQLHNTFLELIYIHSYYQG